MTMLPNCPITNKISYASKKVPHKARHFYKRDRIQHLEPYQCSHCPYFHLTTAAKKKMKKFFANPI